MCCYASKGSSNDTDVLSLLAKIVIISSMNINSLYTLGDKFAVGICLHVSVALIYVRKCQRDAIFNFLPFSVFKYHRGNRLTVL